MNFSIIFNFFRPTLLFKIVALNGFQAWKIYICKARLCLKSMKNNAIQFLLRLRNKRFANYWAEWRSGQFYEAGSRGWTRPRKSNVWKLFKNDVIWIFGLFFYKQLHRKNSVFFFNFEEVGEYDEFELWG